VNVTPKGTVSFLPWREKDIILKGEEWLEDTVWVLVEREEEDGKAARAGGGGVEVCAMEGREASGVGLFVSLIFFVCRTSEQVVVFRARRLGVWSRLEDSRIERCVF